MPTTKLLPVPAGPTRVSTRAPEVSTPRTAAAWSTPSSTPGLRGAASRNRSAIAARRRGGVAAAGGGGHGAFGVDVVGGGVELRAGGVVGRAAVGQAQLVGQRVVAGAGGVERGREREALVGEPVEQAGDVAAVGESEGVGQGVVDRAGEVGAGPGGLAGLDVGQRGLEHRLSVTTGCAAGGSWSRAARTSSATPRSPPATSSRSWASTRSRNCSRVSPVVGLRLAGGHGGLPGEPVALEAVGLAVVAGLELGDQLGGLRGHRAAPRGEQVGDRVVDADDLAGLAVRAHREPHPERVG